MIWLFRIEGLTPTRRKLFYIFATPCVFVAALLCFLLQITSGPPPLGWILIFVLLQVCMLQLADHGPLEGVIVAEVWMFSPAAKATAQILHPLPAYMLEDYGRLLPTLIMLRVSKDVVLRSIASDWRAATAEEIQKSDRIISGGAA